MAKTQPTVSFTAWLGALACDLGAMAAKLGIPAWANPIRRWQAYQHAVLISWKASGSKAPEETCDLLSRSRPSNNLD